MNMKRLLSLVAFFATLQASAQQVNPVPDYVFANRMSAGRNTVTDTAAYFSIGPRYGATRGMMPPMVVDTASFSANKRNGLLIFSVQKNKFLYWDSVGVKWAEMAGTGGSAITGSGVAGYMPEFTTTTNLDTTRLYHSAGRFAIGSTTTSNGVFNVYGGLAYFDTTIQVGSQTLIANEATNEVLVNQSSDAGAYPLQVGGDVYFNGDIRLDGTTDWGIETSVGVEMTSFQIVQRTTNFRYFTIDSAGNFAFGRLSNSTGTDASAYINTNKELIIANSAVDQGDFKLQVQGNAYIASKLFINTVTDAGYQTDINGTLRSVNSTYLATSSGNVGIGTTSAVLPLQYKTYGGFDGNGNQLIIRNNLYYNTTNARSEPIVTGFQTMIEMNNNNGSLVFSTSPSSNSVGTAATIAEAMRINSSGNVGIGINPSYRLDVLAASGTARVFRFSGNAANDNTSIIISGKQTNAELWAYGNEVATGGTGRNFDIYDLVANANRFRINSSGEILLSTTSDAGAYVLQVSGNIYNTGSITTGAPSGGSIKPWKIGEAATVSPTSPNRTLRVEVDGVVYYIHAKTTND